MKRWEKFNELTETPECLEEQAINTYTARIIEIIETGCGVHIADALAAVKFYDMYAAYKKWLNEEDEN